LAGVGGKWKMNVFDRGDMLGESTVVYWSNTYIHLYSK